MNAKFATPVKKPEAPGDKTVAESAYKLLRTDLLRGQFEPAARLRLNELQTRYGLGLSPIREALLLLTSEGLVVAEGQRGFSVAPVSLADLIDLTRMRRLVETVALTESIERGDDEWEVGVMSAFHRLSRTPMPSSANDMETATKWEEKHRAFHNSLIAACGSPWLLRFHAQLVDHTERYRQARLFSPTRKLRGAENEHLAIMTAVLARNKGEASRLAEEHIQRTADAVAQWLASETKE